MEDEKLQRVVNVKAVVSHKLRNQKWIYCLKNYSI